MDNTGEPGFVNVENMCWDSTNADSITPETLLSDELKQKMQNQPKTISMLGDLFAINKRKQYPLLTNHCGEIIKAIW